MDFWLRLRGFGVALLLPVSACSGGGVGASGSGAIPESAVAIQQPGGAIDPAAASTQTICVGGNEFSTTEDDEFSEDSSLGSMWATKLPWGRTNNAGTDDAYYTDPTAGFGGYDPVSFSDGAMNITAEPVPATDANAPALSIDGTKRHWLSGALSGPPQTYGYVEISAREPNLQGFWPAPLWLFGTSGKQPFTPPAFQELDVNELLGSTFGKSSVQQTMLYGYRTPTDGIPVRTVISPDPGTTFHTYGVLWTAGKPGTVTFYVDRHVATPTYPAQSNYPMIPIISLQVFASGTWSLPPVDNTPQTMSLQYFRWYQPTTASCSPSNIVAAAATRTGSREVAGFH
jgi:hypothetical protein